MIAGQSPTFWKRFFSFIIDLLIINLVIVWPFQKLLQQSLPATGQLLMDYVVPPKVYFIVMIIALLALLYFTFFEYYLWQTPGQAILHLEVASLSSNTPKHASTKNTFANTNMSKSARAKETSGNEQADALNFWKCVLRNIYILPLFPFYLFWIIEPIHLAIYRERLLERWSRTRTIEKNSNIIQEYKLQKVT